MSVLTRLVRSAACFGVLGLVSGLFAQTAPKIAFPQASPSATLKQTIGITEVEVNYSRPSMRGRRIFGGLVPYGQVWRTGANAATKVTFSTPVKFGGVDVPAGAYALFTIPDQNDWTVILNKVPDKWPWGSYSYDAANDIARVQVKPVVLSTPVETLAIGIADLSLESGATLYISWDKVRVPVKIETDLVGLLVPQIEAAMASAADKKPYFPAAMFYYENGLDLNKAAEWMAAAVAAQPDAFWMIYRQGLILAKKGDKAGALAAANKSKELAAQQKPGELRDEYIRLNDSLIASLQ